MNHGRVPSFVALQMELSVVKEPVLGERPTEDQDVGCSAFFGIRSADRCVISRQFGKPFWANARQRSNLSVVLRFSVSVQPTEESNEMPPQKRMFTQQPSSIIILQSSAFLDFDLTFQQSGRQ